MQGLMRQTFFQFYQRNRKQGKDCYHGPLAATQCCCVEYVLQSGNGDNAALQEHAEKDTEQQFFITGKSDIHERMLTPHVE